MNGGFQVGAFQTNFQQIGIVAELVLRGGSSRRRKIRRPKWAEQVIPPHPEIYCAPEQEVRAESVQLIVLGTALHDELAMRSQLRARAVRRAKMVAALAIEFMDDE